MMLGPSGERNSYMITPRGHLLVVHSDADTRKQISKQAKDVGNSVTEYAQIPDRFDGFDAVMTAPDQNIDISALRRAMHDAGGVIIPFLYDRSGEAWLWHEHHICQDMTASGGNIDLLMR